MNDDRIKFLINAAVIAALYAALTLLLAPVSFGVVQVRISEALCVLAFFTPAAVPGLTAGCFIANILGPNGITDALLGSAATLIGSYMMYKLKCCRALALLPAVFSNGIIVGLMLHYFYGEAVNPFLCILTVALEEAAALYVLGLPLAKTIDKNQQIFK